MSIYHLYRSGIHEATIECTEDVLFLCRRNVEENNWEEKRILEMEEAEKIEKMYHIHPIKVYQRLPELRGIFQPNLQIVHTSYGAIYQKHEEEQNLWVERERQFPLDIVMIEQEPVAFISPARENCHVLVKAGFESYTPVKLWEEDVSPAQYGINHLGNFRVKMRDGIHLATDVWLPKELEQAVPVIFVRTPYGRLAYEKMYTNYIQCGYGLVIQDTRGRQDSEGEWIPMTAEMEDGDDSLNWIAAQDWCDGNIGMIGASYGGYVQWAAAASGNPYLRALVSIVTAGSAFMDIPRKGGTLVSGMLAWAFAMAEKEFKPENMLRSDWEDIVKMRPLKDIPKKVLGQDIPFWSEWMEHAHEDRFWQRVNWSLHKDAIQAPALIVSGWYDDNGMGTTEALDIVADYKQQDKRVILGPWMHNLNTTRDIHGVPLGNNALRYDLDYKFQQWFDYKLKGINNQIADDPTVQYYITGENKWTSAHSWLPEQVEWQNLYLSSGGKNAASNGEGELCFDDQIHEGYDEYVYDPEQPAPHLIDISENECGVPADYQEVEKRKDVLVYSTEALQESITVAGDLIVKLYAASSAQDTDWIVRLTDVDPKGRSIKLTDGVLRARYRNGFDHEELLESNKVEAYTIRTGKFAHTFKVGHRIRFTVTSSADQFIFPNHNTGQDLATDTEMKKALQKIYHRQSERSHIQLPVIKM
ncbi:CocE/NonD family hydrolase [Lederbergia sp. NSJ-179]|uniref:CocE/NonD family hydrolase n=1 Tax=Lederbergia sp. NSJ-179 TaxID=2931402 RepID=UPI001FCFA1D4|nr:CocE/NonD family hydrolase [Lederbergia sp. NSJ-179]MCJ7842106.1 CocE/NonD family hydrolase [Lederbergia sp. NSJ-179]